MYNIYYKPEGVLVPNIFFSGAFFAFTSSQLAKLGNIPANQSSELTQKFRNFVNYGNQREKNKSNESFHFNQI